MGGGELFIVGDCLSQCDTQFKVSASRATSQCAGGRYTSPTTETSNLWGVKIKTTSERNWLTHCESKLIAAKIDREEGVAEKGVVSDVPSPQNRQPPGL